jgi:branched-chain amino acid transport system ATP-binding protein
VTALEVTGLSLQFGGLCALDDLSMAVEAGERLVILGPNGAGKTTLFNVISGMQRPTRGRIALFGQDVTGTSVARRVGLGLGRTFQIATLFPRLTVLESAMLAVQAGEPHRFVMHRAMGAYAGTRRRAIELLAAWQLDAKADQETRHLSYGEQRRVELVLALARRPRLLLLDEPAAGLSGEETAAVEAMVRQLSRDVTVMLIEHDVDMALRLADRVIVLQQGRLLASGEPEDIRRDPRVAEIYFGAGHA